MSFYKQSDLTLIIDTSTERGIVAISERGNVLFFKALPFGYQSSKWIASEIDSGFKQLQITASELKEIAVGTGPGLFTGIRVGVALAKGLAFAQGIPLMGFSSLEGFISPQEGLFLAMVDLRLGGIAWLLKEKNGENISNLSEVQVSSFEELVKKHPQIPLVGPSFQKLPYAKGLEIYPDANHLAKLIESRILYNQHKNSLNGELELHYLRTAV